MGSMAGGCAHASAEASANVKMASTRCRFNSRYFFRAGGVQGLMRPSQSDLLFSSQEYSMISPFDSVNVLSFFQGFV